ncbi:MAG: penicillin-binding transpeptidase domain-containing protein [Sarcina sp.]
MRANKDLSKNIKTIMSVYLVLLIALIGYIAYFYLFQAPKIAKKPTNSVVFAEQNKILRGTVYDSSMQKIAYSQKQGTGQQRIYPEGALYGAIIGYDSSRYGLDPGSLEQLYNTTLTTYTPNNKFSIKEAFDNRANPLSMTGDGVVTTLNGNLQKVAWNALKAGIASVNQKAGKEITNAGAVVALDPKTGQILASVTMPTFDPNDLSTAMEQANQDQQAGRQAFEFINQVTENPTAPGSVFKMVTLTSALQNIPGVSNRVFDDKGVLKISNTYSLPNENSEAYGEIGLARALSVSSNVVFGTLGMELGNTALKATAESFGFNQAVPSNGVYIAPSNFPTLSSGDLGSMAQSGIGQGQVTATPMQIALVASTIANDGVMMEPTLVKQVVNSQGKVLQTVQPKSLGRKMTTQQAAEITKDMRYVTEQRQGYPSNVWDYMDPKYDIASKTGTAQKGLPNGQMSPYTDATFACFAPANDPKIAIAVKIVNGGAGSVVGAKIAYQMIAEYLTQTGM